MFHCHIYTLTRGYDGELYPRKEMLSSLNFVTINAAIRWFVDSYTGRGDFKPEYLSKKFYWETEKKLVWETKYLLIVFEIMSDNEDEILKAKCYLPPFETVESISLKDMMLDFMKKNPAIKFPREIMIELGEEEPTVYDAVPYLRHFKKINSLIS